MPADPTLRELAQMFARFQGSSLMGEEEPVTTTQDEGRYIMRYDAANHTYQLLRVLRYTDTGNLHGASFEYPVGRRGYSGNDMAALLTLLCGSTVTMRPAQPVPVRHFQDEVPPYILPKDDPWYPLSSSSDFIEEADRGEVTHPEFPFRIVVELGFESCGSSELIARQRVVYAVEDFLARMEEYSEDPELSDEGSGHVNAALRIVNRWEDHADYPRND
jgi:hypothetical protein